MFGVDSAFVNDGCELAALGARVRTDVPYPSGWPSCRRPVSSRAGAASDPARGVAAGDALFGAFAAQQRPERAPGALQLELRPHRGAAAFQGGQALAGG